MAFLRGIFSKTFAIRAVDSAQVAWDAITLAVKNASPDRISIRSVQHAEEIARKMGVKAEFFDNLPMANNVAEALQLLEQRGVKLPAELKIKNDYNLNVLESPTGAAGRFVHDTDFYGMPIEGASGTIYLNPHYPWNKMSAYIQALRQNNLAAANHPSYIFIHEVGHAKHYKEAGMLSKTSTGYPPAVEDLILQSGLGSNAAKNSSELVADMFAKKVLEPKWEIPESVMEHYTYRGGPKLPD